jgi:uncharacterized membrane protein (UPF0127 family)
VRRWILLAALASACRGAPAPSSPPDATNRLEVIIESANGRAYRVAAETARTPEERARGLMHRDRLPEDEGMLFFFETDEDHSFWMKDTLIPLDMIFIDQGMKVVGIVENAEPLSTAPRRGGAPSRYTLEVIGGWSGKRGVAVGDRVRF